MTDDERIAALQQQWAAYQEAARAWLEQQTQETAIAMTAAYRHIGAAHVGAVLAALDKARQAAQAVPGQGEDLATITEFLLRRLDEIAAGIDEISGLRRQLTSILVLEPTLRAALGLPADDENTMDLVIEIAIDGIERAQAVVRAAEALHKAVYPYVRKEWLVLSSLKRIAEEDQKAWEVAWAGIQAYEAALKGRGDA